MLQACAPAAIALTVLCANLVGDALRDRLETPNLRGPFAVLALELAPGATSYIQRTALYRAESGRT